MKADDSQHPTTKRRGHNACQRCHEKKLQCDLQRLDAACSRCEKAGVSCAFRHLKKRVSRDDSPSRIFTEGAAQLVNAAVQEISMALERGGYSHALSEHQTMLRGGKFANSEEILPAAQACDNLTPGAMRSYLESYIEFCYTWCPTIDVDDPTMATESVLLDHSLAAVASMLRPSLLPGLSRPEEHYERARRFFHTERHHSNIVLVKAALMLSYCDNSRLGSPTDSSFWWIGIAIRLAQDLRLHRAPQNVGSEYSIGLQRRIWWTLFARERIMSLCHGRPSIIDEDDGNLGQPTEADFPASRLREAQTFINWVSICRIMGAVNKDMSIARQTGARIEVEQVAASLTRWVSRLPDDLQLGIQNAQTAPCVRDIHILHLPYLTTISLMYFNTTGQDLLEVAVAATMASTCTARIIGDLLLRGSIHTLPEEAGWFITIAITALLHIRPLTHLFTYAAADLHVLRTALTYLGATWTSARVLAAGLDKVLINRVTARSSDDGRAEQAFSSAMSAVDPPSAACTRSGRKHFADGGVQLRALFPFATVQTSRIAEAILNGYLDGRPELWCTPDLGEDLAQLWNELVAGQVDVG